ncbi:MAG: YheC/YheD family protein [Methylocystaceae bacterium]
MIELKANRKIPPGQVHLPDIISRQLSSRNLHLTVGTRHLTLTVSGFKMDINLHPQDLRDLGIPDGIRWRWGYDSQLQQLTLGPYLGIITTPPTTENQKLPFGTRTGAYREISQLAAEKGGLVAVFTPQQLVASSAQVSGQVFTNSWNILQLPLPRVFYNRIPTRQLEKNHQSVLSRLEKNGHIIFNTRFINKPEVYTALQTDPVLNAYLPETIAFSDEALSYFLTKGTSFFLKPSSSALGKGIIKVEADGANWHCLRQEKTRLLKYPNRSSEAMKRLLLSFCRGRNYLLQQAVPLAGNDGRVFDLRCLIQKNGQGQWEVVGLGARVSAPGLYLTHVPNGGEVWPAGRALAWCFGDEKNSSPENLESILVDTATLLEERLGLHLAMLSADVGLNAEGYPFILELNSKPQRFDETTIRMSSHRHLLDYAGYLEGISG